MKFRIVLLGFLFLGSIAVIGCKEDTYGLVEAKPKKVIAVVESLNHEDFDKLNHVEKSQALEILTKVYSVEYLIAPDQVALEIPQHEEYKVALFKKHDAPVLVTFLGEEFERRLDKAPESMAVKDNKVRGREQRLINLLAKQYLQALIIANARDEYRVFLEASGPNAVNDPYVKADSLLVHANGSGYVQQYLIAARNNDKEKMAEYRAKIDEVFKPIIDNTIDYTPAASASSNASESNDSTTNDLTTDEESTDDETGDDEATDDSMTDDDSGDDESSDD